MLHSFGNHSLGKTKDENLTASETGNSPEAVIKHYRAMVRNADVTRYWGLVPRNVSLGNASKLRPQPARGRRLPKPVASLRFIILGFIHDPRGPRARMESCFSPGPIHITPGTLSNVATKWRQTERGARI